jgi:hypothetical protein
MSRKKENSFVADGAERIAEHLRKEIKQEVRAKYEKQLSAAGRLRYFWLKMRMQQEIERRLRRELKEKAPKDALYFGPRESADRPGGR